MATNEYVNKVVYGSDTLIDLTGDDVQESDVRAGVKFHKPSGEPATGTSSGGGSGGVIISDEPDSHGGIVRTIIASEVYIDGDNLSYGGAAIVGSAIVGTATAG